jgi:ferredoxin--NADP+ reductase
MLKERNVRIVTYQDWQKIDEAEMTAASNQAPRKKFVTVKEMISALD